MKIGSIKIGLEFNEAGDQITTLKTEGDLAFVTMVGMLEMAKDSLFRGTYEEHDEG